ncbi:hypothetical protein ACWTU6_20745 [Mesorhizobium sp. BHbsci]
MAGVAIAPAPTSGVLVGWQTHQVDRVPFLGQLAQRHDHVAQVLRHALRTDCAAGTLDATYDRYIVPTAGRVYWDGLVSAAGKISWDNPDRAPLLLIGGGIDLIAQAKDDQGHVREAEAGAVEYRAQNLSRPLALDLY